MNQADVFSEQAGAMEHAVRCHDASGMKAVIECSRLLANLYSVGLSLPSAASDDAEFEEPEKINDNELDQVMAYASRLPFQYYNEALEPLEIEVQECGLGDIADDLRDI